MSASYLPLLVLVAVVPCLTTGLTVSLEHLSSVYLPYAFVNGQPQKILKSEIAESAVFEPTDKIVYAVGPDMIHVIDAKDPKMMTYLGHATDPVRTFIDVTVCKTKLFVTYQEKANKEQGGVIVYKLWSRTKNELQSVTDVRVDSQPERVVATSTCMLVVAVQNPALTLSTGFTDPQGQVAILEFPQQDLNSQPQKTLLDFTAFDSKFDELKTSGVRWLDRGSKFSDDLEPESVTLNGDQTKAYVSFQDNNAVAEVDLTTKTVTSLRGLGFKDWSKSKLDPSDKDGGVHLAAWDVMGMPLPDGIAWFRQSDTDYVITANEGSDREVRGQDEDIRGKDFSASSIDASVKTELVDALKNDTKLGRLQFSNLEGKNAAGKYTAFYAFGTRSFSIYKASDMSRVYDSGSDLEEKMAQLRPDLFNTYLDKGSSVPKDDVDERSDSKGPEPESVAVTKTKEGNHIIFVGLERPGAIAVYTVPGSGSLQPKFQSLFTGGIPVDSTRTWDQMYADGTLYAVDTGHISVIEPSSGIADYPILMVVGEESGTLSMLKVNIKDDQSSSAIRQQQAGYLLASVTSLVVLRITGSL